MTKLTYREQLLHPNWQRKRLDILQRDNFACKMCGDKENTLHVHHKQYAKGRMPWEYPDDELVTLCVDCHESMHEQKDMLRDVTAKLPVDGPGSVTNGTAVLAGWAHGSQGLDFSHVYALSPGDFMSGEIAALLWDKGSATLLAELIEALRGAPYWVINAQGGKFVQALKDHASDPKPPLPPGMVEL